MSRPRKKKTGTKKAVLQRDEYRVTPPEVRPSSPAIDRGRPKTLGELGIQVKRHLYSIAVGLIALPDEAIGAVRKLVRKSPDYVPDLVKGALVTPKVAEAIARRIDRADKVEAKAQQSAAAGKPVPTAANASAELAAILARFAAQGLHVEIVDVNGTPTPIVVRPELAAAARELAALAAAAGAAVTAPVGEG